MDTITDVDETMFPGFPTRKQVCDFFNMSLLRDRPFPLGSLPVRCESVRVLVG